MSIAGHVSTKVLAHYSHLRLQAKRMALDALVSGRRDTTQQKGYDTSNDSCWATEFTC
ncbi:MAG TPA: hypothetical protein VFQ24_16620 [Terriglobia bacterium]|nr:hypothetical protein [Terriglobia bacterium]